MLHEYLGHSVENILALLISPPLPRMFADTYFSALTVLTGMATPTRRKISHVEIPKFKARVLRNLLPRFLKLQPSISRRNTKCSSGDPGLPVRAAIVYIDYVCIAHDESPILYTYGCSLSAITQV